MKKTAIIFFVFLSILLFWNISCSQEQAKDDEYQTTSSTSTIVGSTSLVTSSTSTTNASTLTSTTYVSSTTTSTSTTTTVTTTTIVGKEINIKYNGINVEDGTTDLNIGETVYGTPKDLVFTIENQGSQNIILSGTPTKISLAGDCFSLKTDAGASIILPGKSTTFTIKFDPIYNADIDTEWNGSITIANDDANENPYNFTIKGRGVINPELSIEYNSSIINDEAFDYTLTFPNGFTNDLKFTVKNIGVGNLLLTGSPRVTVSGSEFSLFQDAVGTISDGEYSEFIVKFSPAGSGTYTGFISIASNDDDNNPYNFSFKIVLANYEPEINVKLNDLNITDGSSNIDVGEILYDATKDITFIIENSGTSDLYLVGNPIINFSGTCFTLIKTIDNPLILPSKSASFTIRFTPNISSESAEYLGTISIMNNDSDEEIFNFTIKGKSIINPKINIKDDSNNIPNGKINYNFGTLKYGETKDITFTIENTGLGDLILSGATRVALSGTGFSLKKDAVSILKEGESTTFIITFSPLSSYSGNYNGNISIVNNDNEQNPFIFTITGIGLMNPEINVKEGLNTVLNGTVDYNIGSVTFGTPKDVIFNIQNSGLSPLVISNINVSGEGFSLKKTISENISVDSSSDFIITFTPITEEGNYSGTITITNNDIDESIYTFTIKITVIPTVASPNISVITGTYINNVLLSITSETTGATIRYTIDGSEPTNNIGEIYSNSITISSSLTLKAIAYKENWNNSSVISVNYIVKCAQPTFNVQSGIYDTTQDLIISTTTVESLITYTLDGTTPTIDSIKYEQPINIPMNSNLTVKAKTFKSGLEGSELSSSNYITTYNYVPFKITSGIFQAQGVAISPVDNNIYVCDKEEANIKVYNTNGDKINQFGVSGTNYGKLGMPYGIAIDSSGYIFITDLSKNQIHKYSPSYTFMFSWGELGSGEGQLSQPKDIKIDSTDIIHVLDEGNTRIQKFNTDGDFISSWGSTGTNDGQFILNSNIWGIAINSNGDVYVTEAYSLQETYFHRIQKFDSNGNFIKLFGSYGIKKEEFNTPMGITTDSEDCIYIVDYANKRFQKYNSEEKFLTIYNAFETGYEFIYPRYIDVNNLGDIYITRV